MTDAELPNTVEECHELKYENKELKERLNNNSSNSSLPPSKDFKKKKNKKPVSKNKSGGQIGHKGHFRQLLDSKEVDFFI